MKRNCNYTEQDLIRYLQNKMTRAEETAFQHHLLSCPECEDRLVRIRILFESLEKKTKDARRWVLALAIACSLGGGTIYLAHRTSNPMPRDGMPLEINHPDSHHSVDSIQKPDSLTNDSIEFEIREDD